MTASDPPVSSSHLVLMPSFNSGSLVLDTARAVLAQWAPVWVVVDGSTDESPAQLRELETRTRCADTQDGERFRVLHLLQNKGKGAAVLTGLVQARDAGFTHVLCMDADGQHPANLIKEFMRLSEKDPGAMILGKPVFDATAPQLRVKGRKISNFWAQLETLWGGIADSLFGFRVYPIEPLYHVMQSTRFARRFDFDVEVVVRLYWCGVEPINIPAPVRYLSAAEGGVSQFRYVRDNTLLTWMHMRLVIGFLLRLPGLLSRKISR